MKDWLLLIGTTLEAMIVAGAAAIAGGLPWCAVACVVGGWCMAQRDSGYQAGQLMRAESKQ